MKAYKAAQLQDMARRNYDTCGNDMYIHVISRFEHQAIAAEIKQDVLDGFSK